MFSGLDFILDKYQRDGEQVNVKIWDTAGQERFRTITANFYRQAHGIIVCFDMTNRESFENVQNWMNSIYKNTQPHVYKVLVGNKMDLEGRVVPRSDAEKIALEHNIEYFETSAKEGTNIQELFQHVETKVYDYLFKDQVPEAVKPSIIISGRRKPASQ